MRIGIIQTRGIGDIVIAAPIADYYIDLGHEVFWPVDIRFVDFLKPAFPKINFLPIDVSIHPDNSTNYYFHVPLDELTKLKCTQIYCLYSYLQNIELPARNLATALKFDEYKYAVSAVPFAHKWNLNLSRDLDRENTLRDLLSISSEYILIHDTGSDFCREVVIPAEILDRYQVITVSPVTNNPFDWIGIIEGASRLIAIDSYISNLAEQLDLCPEKLLVLRSDIAFTPVLKNNWTFI
jgi:hypothetical protein